MSAASDVGSEGPSAEATPRQGYGDTHEALRDQRPCDSDAEASDAGSEALSRSSSASSLSIVAVASPEDEGLFAENEAAVPCVNGASRAAPSPSLGEIDSQPVEQSAQVQEEQRGGPNDSLPRKKRKPNADPVQAAARRVRLRQKKEAKAARKARKKERKLARARRGSGQDLEAFLVRTLERLQAKAAELMAEAARAMSAANDCPADPSKRGSESELESFLKRSRGRAANKLELAEVARKAQQAAITAEEAVAAAAVKLQDFRQRLSDVPSSICPAVATKSSRRRIAIIGAGPVGLWAAVLLAQKHSCGDTRGFSTMWPDAPQIVIYESRVKEAHCSRTDIRIALSPATQQLLNNRTHSTKFCTGMPIAEIEKLLLKRLKKLSPQARPQFAYPISDPAGLSAEEGFDCVLWASGRRSLDDSLRVPLGCELRTGDVNRVLVFQFCKLEIGGSIDSDLAMAARIATKWQSFRVLMRPGVKGVCDGWLWLFGLPSDAVARAPRDSSQPAGTFREALERILDESSPNSELLLGAADVFQHRIRCTECTARWVEAAFWSSDRVLCDLGALSSAAAGCPFLVLGDAACGKPFYTGTTLNGHLKDVAAMVDEVDWLPDGTSFGCNRFQAHERRYQAEVHRIAQFERRAARAPSPARPAADELLESPGEDRATLARTVSLPHISPRSRVVSPMRTADAVAFSKLGIGVTVRV